MVDEPKNQPCCAPGDPCRPKDSVGADCCAPVPASRKSWRTAAFGVIMLAAVAMMAYGLLGGHSSSDVEAEAAGSSSESPVLAAGFTSIPAIQTLHADHDVVFALLPGPADLAKNARERLSSGVTVLQTLGRQAADVVFSAGSEEHRLLAVEFNIADFPCILALGKGCGSARVAPGFSDDAFLQAYVKASCPPSSCGPNASCGAAGGGKSCCPSQSGQTGL